MKVFEAPPQTRDAILRKYGEVFLGSTAPGDLDGITGEELWDLVIQVSNTSTQEQYATAWNALTEHTPYYMDSVLETLTSIVRDMVAGRIDEGMCEWLCYQAVPLLIGGGVDEPFPVWSKYTSAGEQRLIWPEDKDRGVEVFNWYMENRKDSNVQNRMREMFPGRSIKNVLLFSIYELEDLQDSLTPVSVQAAKNTRWKPEDRGISPLKAETVFEEGGWLVVKIMDAGVASTYASGTRWCTSSKGTAAGYLANGPLYVLFRNGQKYGQIHGQSNQVMDVRDRPINDLDPVVAGFMAGSGVEDIINLWGGMVNDEVMRDQILSDVAKEITSKVADAESKLVAARSQLEGMESGDNPISRTIFSKIFPSHSPDRIKDLTVELDRYKESLLDVESPTGEFQNGKSLDFPVLNNYRPILDTLVSERQLASTRELENLFTSTQNLLSRVTGSLSGVNLPAGLPDTLTSILADRSSKTSRIGEDYAAHSLQAVINLTMTLEGSSNWNQMRGDLLGFVRLRLDSGRVGGRVPALMVMTAIDVDYAPQYTFSPGPQLDDPYVNLDDLMAMGQYILDHQFQADCMANHSFASKQIRWLEENTGLEDVFGRLWSWAKRGDGMGEDNYYVQTSLKQLLTLRDLVGSDDTINGYARSVLDEFARRVTVEMFWSSAQPTFSGSLEQYTRALEGVRSIGEGIYGKDAIQGAIDATENTEEVVNEDEMAAAIAEVMVDDNGKPTALGNLLITGGNQSLQAVVIDSEIPAPTQIPNTQYKFFKQDWRSDVVVESRGLVVYPKYEIPENAYRYRDNFMAHIIRPSDYPLISVACYELSTDEEMLKAVEENKVEIKTSSFSIPLSGTIPMLLECLVMPTVSEERIFTQINSKGDSARPSARYGWMCLCCAKRVEWDSDSSHWIGMNYTGTGDYGAKVHWGAKDYLQKLAEVESPFASDCRGVRLGNMPEITIDGLPEDFWASHVIEPQPSVLWCDACNGARAISANMGFTVSWKIARAISPCKCGYKKSNMVRDAEQEPTEAEITEEILGSLGDGGPVGLGAETFDAEYVAIPESDMESFMTSLGFVRASLPRTREIVYERVYGRGPDNGVLKIRVYSSITGGRAREAGKDAIRVVPIYDAPGMGEFPMAKLKRVHRVTGWRRNLLRRIDSAEESTPGPVMDSSGKPMRLRRNRNTGDYFWGSVDYPTNTETRPYRG